MMEEMEEIPMQQNKNPSHPKGSHSLKLDVYVQGIKLQVATSLLMENFWQVLDMTRRLSSGTWTTYKQRTHPKNTSMLSQMFGLGQTLPTLQQLHLMDQSDYGMQLINNEIRYWKLNPFSCGHISRGGTAQVRFQPRVGQLLAAASDKVVSVFDVENDRIVQSFQEHSGAVNYICWDVNGELLACVSPDSVKVWSLSSGESVHELNSTGSQFHSCVFHPSYATLLVVGGTRSIELWKMADNKRMTVQAHENIISALATSVSGMVTSAGHDCSVKLWK